MTAFDHNGHESSLDAFLDGTLSDADRAQWMIRVREDDGVHMQMTRQETIDAALRQLFSPDAPTRERCVARLRTHIDGSGIISDQAAAVWSGRAIMPTRGRSRRASLLALAAAVGLCAVAGWQIKEFLSPADRPYVYAVQKWRSLDRIYHDELAGGFKPAWVCANDAEFAAVTRRQLGQAVLLAQVQGLSALGWSYANTLSPNTMYLLASAPEAKVLVFMQPVEGAREPVVEPESGLKLHQRIVGQVALYEVSPLDEPRVLPHFYEPPAPDIAAPP